MFFIALTIGPTIYFNWPQFISGQGKSSFRRNLSIGHDIAAARLALVSFRGGRGVIYIYSIGPRNVLRFNRYHFALLYRRGTKEKGTVKPELSAK